jgi:PKD repeat protein
MKMIDSYGNDGADMADTWTVFGDPTIMVRTSAPSAMAVVHPTSFTVGDTSFTISCDTEGARITLTVADSIMATGLVTDSALTLVFPALTTPFDTIRMVVTSYNKIPYQVELPVEDFILLPVQALFDATPLRVLPGGEVAFADSSTGTVLTWEWSFPGGTPSSSTEQHPVVMYDARGTYDVTLIVGNGLYSDTLVKTEYITCDFPTSSGVKTAKGYTARPNPTNGLFELSFPAKGTYDVSVVNIVGAEVYTHNEMSVGSASNQVIDLRGMTAGLYFLRIKHENEVSILKLVIR